VFLAAIMQKLDYILGIVNTWQQEKENKTVT
jgi:hypothetical protein